MLASNLLAASSLASDPVIAFRRRSISACCSLNSWARLRVASACSLEALVALDKASCASASFTISLVVVPWQSKWEKSIDTEHIPASAGAGAGHVGWRGANQDFRNRQRPGFCRSDSPVPGFFHATTVPGLRTPLWGGGGCWRGDRGREGSARCCEQRHLSSAGGRIAGLSGLRGNINSSTRQNGICYTESFISAISYLTLYIILHNV